MRGNGTRGSGANTLNANDWRPRCSSRLPSPHRSWLGPRGPRVLLGQEVATDATETPAVTDATVQMAPPAHRVMMGSQDGTAPLPRRLPGLPATRT